MAVSYYPYRISQLRVRRALGAIWHYSTLQVSKEGPERSRGLPEVPEATEVPEVPEATEVKARLGLGEASEAPGANLEEC